MPSTRPFFAVALAATMIVSQVPAFAGKMLVEVEKGADFSKFKTYQWVPTRTLTKKGIVDNDPEFTPAIESAVNKQLQLRGLKEVQSGADLKVACSVINEPIPQMDAILPLGGPELEYNTGMNQQVLNDVRINDKGTFVMNLIDVKTKQSAFFAAASQMLPTSKEEVKKIEEQVVKMFKKYPVK
jgi:hypothetical protein